MSNTKVTSHVIANNAISASMIQSAAVTDAKLHSTLDLSGKTLTLPATAIPSASTATTQAASDNSTKLATTAYVTTAISNLVDSSPSSLNTLNELAAALNDDASFSTTVTNSIATKAPLANPTFTTAINGADNVLLQLGSSQDLQIWHDATNTNIKNSTGDLNIRADIIRLKSADGGEEYASFVDNSLVTLNFDNVEKLRTADYGVQISGTGALKIPVGTTGQRPTAATGQIRWNSTDGAIEVYNGSAWTAVGTGSSNKVLNTFTGDGSTTTFTLTVTPANEDALMVFIDGAYQEAGDYVLTNNQLALDVAPLSGEKVSAHITTASVHDGTSAVNQQFTGDGSTTAFTLSQDPDSENNTQIYINGVYQQKTDYTVTGTTLTFDTAPANGDIIEVNMFTVATLGNTDTVTEGVSNLYHTDARARGAISVSGNAISYNSSTGVLTANFEEGPTFTNNVQVSGSLGIGSSPSFPLHINAATTDVAKFQTSGSYTYTRFQNSSKTWALSVGNDFSFYDEAASATRMVIDNTGKVGIGVSSPSAALHIQTEDGTTNSAVNSLMITNLSTGTTTTGFGGEIRFQAERNNGVNQNTGGIRSIAEVNSGTNISSGMAFDTSTAGVNSEKLRISYDGKVGIGNSNPHSKLHLNGSSGQTNYTSHANVDEYLSTFQTSYNGTGSQNLNIVNHNGNWQDGNTGSDSAFGFMWAYENSIRAGIHYDHRGTEKFDFYSSYAPFRFRVPSSANGNLSPIGTESTMPAALTVAPGGNVGIGVDNPTRLLHLKKDDTTTYTGNSAGTNIALHLANTATGAAGRTIGIGMSSETNAEVYLNCVTAANNNGGDFVIASRSGGRSEKMRLHAAGPVTKPLNPSFLARLPAVTNGGNNTIIFGGTHHNIGSHYNTSNGIFTAPVTGSYLFTFAILMDPSGTNHYARILFAKNGTSGSTQYGDTLETADYDVQQQFQYLSMSSVIYLSANDTIRLQNDGNSPTYGSSYGSFGGYLLG